MSASRPDLPLQALRRPSPAPIAPAPPAPDYVPEEWLSERPPEPVRPRSRDLSLDLIRGLAIVVLIFNHVLVTSGLQYAAGAVISAAEVLVAVSGVVVGIVFGRRWLEHGARETTMMLLRRSRKLYVASVAVVALVGLLSFVPGLATEFLTGTRSMAEGVNSYSYDSVPRLLLAVVTLEAGPWQFNILGFFIAAIALAPAVLWGLSRGAWPVVLGASAALYWVGTEFHPDVLPSQSERVFPFLIWQFLFVGGAVIGWHRERIAAALGRWRRSAGATIVALAVGFAAALVAMQVALGDAGWKEWELANFDKGTLDLSRVFVTAVLIAGLYLILRRYERPAARLAGPLLLPLGQNSFYVFIMHVFVCLALASIPVLAAGGFGLLGNSLIEAGAVAALWLMVTRRFLFRWVPR
ncbi:MAG TPA: OpgC domain-containing protein [Solirubrobacterales bacterium]|nr:OpgC domain-containing protein [Solirubrobacterales bacterium]